MVGVLVPASADEGQIVEDHAPEEFFQNPRHSRAKRFLETIL